MLRAAALRDGMGREVGERVREGNTCTPMADSCECMAKTTTILYKVISLQLNLNFFLKNRRGKNKSWRA